MDIGMKSLLLWKSLTTLSWQFLRNTSTFLLVIFFNCIRWSSHGAIMHCLMHGYVLNSECVYWTVWIYIEHWMCVLDGIRRCLDAFDDALIFLMVHGFIDQWKALLLGHGRRRPGNHLFISERFYIWSICRLDSHYQESDKGSSAKAGLSVRSLWFS